MSSYDDTQCSNTWKQWEKTRSYMRNKNFPKAVQEWIDFYEGRQWKNNKLTVTFPKVMINIIKMIVDNKVANILGSPVKLNYVADNDRISTDKFTRFASYQMKEMGLASLNRRAILDGEVKGTYIYHFYWDEDAVGKLGNYKGAMRGEIIDMRNIGFSNPAERDIQKQKWIIIASREEVKAIKKMADTKNKDVKVELIVSDENYDKEGSEEKEQDESGLCTVLTKYFRINGEVYFERSVKGTLVHGAKPLNPNITYKKIKKRVEKENVDSDSEYETYETDTQIVKMQDDTVEDDVGAERKFYLYPIEVGNLSIRDGSIFGLSDVEGMIFSQKSINFQMSMIVKNAQDLGWGKWIVKENALRGQKITNEIGQVLTDYTPAGVNGIQLASGQQFSNGAIDLASVLIDMVRTVTNASEIFTGDMISKDLSGTAIAQIQAQTKKPIDAQQKAFFTSMERCGKIFELFYKYYYEEEEFSYGLDTDEIYEESQKLQIDEDKVEKTRKEIFNGTEFENIPFSVVVEAGAGSQYSEIMAMDTLNNLFMNGGIRNMTSDQLEQYITLYPDSAMPFKAELRKIIRKQRKSELAQLQQENEQLQEQMQILAEKLTYADSYISQLNKQFKDEVEVKDQKIKSMEKFMANTKVNASLD